MRPKRGQCSRTMTRGRCRLGRSRRPTRRESLIATGTRRLRPGTEHRRLPSQPARLALLKRLLRPPALPPRGRRERLRPARWPRFPMPGEAPSVRKARARGVPDRALPSPCKNLFLDRHAGMQSQTIRADEGHDCGDHAADLHLHGGAQIARTDPQRRRDLRLARAPGRSRDANQAWRKNSPCHLDSKRGCTSGRCSRTRTGECGGLRRESLRPPDRGLDRTERQQQRDGPSQCELDKCGSAIRSFASAHCRLCCSAVTAGNMTTARNGRSTPTPAGSRTWFNALRL